MAAYDTVTKTIGDITVTVSRAKEGNAGDRLRFFLKWLDTKIPVDPGYGVGTERPSHPIAPGGSPGKPDQGLPGQPPKPDQGLPPSGGGGKPDQGLPGAPPQPDQGLPPNFLTDHADEIIKAILKGTACDPARPDQGLPPSAQPKK
jgi:hypothetical protein